MQPPVFYSPPDRFADASVALPAEEVHHAARVMRLKVGMPVVVVNGQGTAIRGELTSLHEKDASHVRIMHVVRNFGEPLVSLTLACGLSTGSKFDEIVQRGTELGVSRFVPILTDKSRVRIEEPKRVQNRLRRLEKVGLAAMKQCRRSYRPDIEAPCRLEEFLSRTEAAAANLLFHPAEAISLEAALPDRDVRRVSVLVGPESGFSEDEVVRAVESGYRTVSLGQRILRAETAGPVICGLVMHRLGELH